jgi:hypothetical protein
MPISNYIATRTLIAKNIQEKVDKAVEQSSPKTTINAITTTAYSMLTEFYMNEILTEFDVDVKLMVEGVKPKKYQIEIDVKYSTGMLDSFILYTDYIDAADVAYKRAMSIL